MEIKSFKESVDSIFDLFSLRYLLIFFVFVVGTESILLYQFNKNILYLSQINFTTVEFIQQVPMGIIMLFLLITAKDIISFVLCLFYDKNPFIWGRPTRNNDCFSIEELSVYASATNNSAYLNSLKELDTKRQHRKQSRFFCFCLLILIPYNFFMGWSHSIDSVIFRFFQVNEHVSSFFSIFFSILAIVLFYESLLSRYYDNDYETNIKYPENYKRKSGRDLITVRKESVSY